MAEMVDLFCLLAAPGAGDDLQGIKRGVMELAELVVVTKADGDLAPAANRAAADLRHALHLMRPLHAAWTPQVLLSSAIEGTGLAEVWEAVIEHRTTLRESGDLDRLARGTAPPLAVVRAARGAGRALRRPLGRRRPGR